MNERKQVAQTMPKKESSIKKMEEDREAKAFFQPVSWKEALLFGYSLCSYKPKTRKNGAEISNLGFYA